jgi:hypothetical protein
MCDTNYIRNKITIFIVNFLKTQYCKKIFVKFDKNLFLFEINIQLKNNRWIQFSILYEMPNNLYLCHFDTKCLRIHYIKKSFGA